MKFTAEWRTELKTYNTDEYLRPKNYVGFLIAKFMHGGVGKAVIGIYKKIRKYTLISGIIRTAAIAVSLLEKSAVLLLLVTALILTLPALILAFVIYRLICVVNYALFKNQIHKWLILSEKIVVFITKERVFSTDEEKMFLRQAKQEAALYSYPVIVICNDPIIAAKWYSLNLLAIKTDYFFVLKRKYFEKYGNKTTYIVL